MTTEAVKKEIKKKFGSYSEFARLAGIDRYEFQKSFLESHKVEKKEIKRIHVLCANTEGPKPEISQEKIDKLRVKVDEAGGVITFCRKHSDIISEQSLFTLLRGGRNRLTNKVKDVFEYFEIKI